MKVPTNKAGLTLVEIAVVLAIFIIIILVGSNITSSLSSVNKEEILNKEMTKIKSGLEEARALTLSSKAGGTYGIHFDADKIILFQGSSYSSGNSSNVIQNIDSNVNISNIVLTGGGSDVIFQKISGETNQNGNVTIVLKSNTSKTKNVTVTKTGLIIAN